MSSLYVGVDSGGTKTALVAEGPAGTVRLSGPGAQAMRDGAGGAAETIAALVHQALDGADLAGLAVGLAGAGRAETQAEVARALAEHLGPVPVVVLHDAAIAYHAAWGDASGALMLVGTGSHVFARTHDGDELRAGGWGAALGDDGSGTALGRGALRALLATLDGGPPSLFPDLAADTLGLASADDVVRAVYRDRQPLASFAPLALAAAEAGDWTAETLLRAETNALARQAGWLATRGDGRVAKRLQYTGGLASEPVYRASLDDALARHLPGWSVGLCETEPAEGALALAKSRAQD